MDTDTQGAAATRLRRAGEMADFGREMMLMKLRRDFPDEGEQQLRLRLRKMTCSRPMKAPGRVTRYQRS